MKSNELTAEWSVKSWSISAMGDALSSGVALGEQMYLSLPTPSPAFAL